MKYMPQHDIGGYLGLHIIPERSLRLALWLQITQSRSYSHPLAPNVGILYILGALGEAGSVTFRGLFWKVV